MNRGCSIKRSGTMLLGPPGTWHATSLARRRRSASVNRDELSTKRTDDQDLLRGLWVPALQVPEGWAGAAREVLQTTWLRRSSRTTPKATCAVQSAVTDSLRGSSGGVVWNCGNKSCSLWNEYCVPRTSPLPGTSLQSLPRFREGSETVARIGQDWAETSERGAS